MNRHGLALRGGSSCLNGHTLKFLADIMLAHLFTNVNDSKGFFKFYNVNFFRKIVGQLFGECIFSTEDF